MGFFSGLADAFGFGEGGAKEAADKQREFLRSANRQLEEKFSTTEAAFDPFVQAGFGGLEGAVQGSTAGGLDERLGEIFGGESFRNLVGERTRAVRGQLAAGGLTRSGQAVEDIAAIPTELGFGIENLLSGRQQGLAGQGFNAISNIGGLRQALGQNIAGNLSAQGQVFSQGVLGGRANQAAGVGNLIGTVAGGIVGANKAGGFSQLLKGAFR